MKKWEYYQILVFLFFQPMWFRMEDQTEQSQEATTVFYLNESTLNLSKAGSFSFTCSAVCLCNKICS